MAEQLLISSRGRRKLPLEKIKNKKNLQVTFSKRRMGIAKKLLELCTLTGAKGVFIVFNAKNKPFSFGCPDVQSVLDNYLNNGQRQEDNDNSPNSTLFVNDCADEISALEQNIEEEKKRAAELHARIMQRRSRQSYWWEVPTEQLTLKEAETYGFNLLNLRVDLLSKNKVPLAAATTTSYIRNLLNFLQVNVRNSNVVAPHALQECMMMTTIRSLLTVLPSAASNYNNLLLPFIFPTETFMTGMLTIRAHLSPHNNNNNNNGAAVTDQPAAVETDIISSSGSSTNKPAYQGHINIPNNSNDDPEMGSDQESATAGTVKFAGSSRFFNTGDDVNVQINPGENNSSIDGDDHDQALWACCEEEARFLNLFFK